MSIQFHSKPIQDYEISKDSKYLSTITRSDAIIRIWKLPDSTSDYDSAKRSDIESPEIFLAGHEKKIEIIKYHPTCKSIIISASMDSSIKIWDIGTYQEVISLDIPNETIPTSMDITTEGSFVTVAASDGLIHLYDPRANSFPVKSWLSNHNTSKSVRLASIPHWDYNYVLSTGFNTQNEREIKLYDFRNLQKPIDKPITIPSGSAPIIPICDESLPVIYFCMKGEGIRVFEVENGMLNFQNAPKIEKQFVDTQLLAKSLCDRSKCEIARFLFLGVDKTIDFQSICIPRKTDSNNQDLYPPLINFDYIPVEDWLKRDSENTLNAITTIKPVLSVKEKIEKQLQIEKESEVKLFQKNWVTCTILLKSGNLYLALGNNYELKLLGNINASKLVTKFDLNELELHIANLTYSFKFQTKEEFEQWYQLLDSKCNLPILPQTKTHALLLEFFMVYGILDQPKKGDRYLVTLTEHNLLHFYSPDMKVYLSGVDPKICLHLNKLQNILVVNSKCISLYFDSGVFHFEHFNKEVISLWSDLIRNNTGLNFPKILKYGSCSATINAIYSPNIWVVVFDNAIFYFDNQLSNHWSHKICGEKWKDSRMMHSKPNELELHQTDLIINHIFRDSSEDWFNTFEIFNKENFSFFNAFNISQQDFVKFVKDRKYSVSSSSIRELDHTGSTYFTKPMIIKVYPCQSHFLAESISLPIFRPESNCCLLGDTGDKIYIWSGKGTTKLCQAEAVSIATTIRKERGCKVLLVFADEYENKRNFSKLLNLDLENDHTESPAPVSLPVPYLSIFAVGVSDPTSYRALQKLYEGDIASKNVLATSCIVRCGHEVFCWFQNSQTVLERNLILAGAKCLLLSLSKKFKEVFFSEEYEGRESALFKKKFSDFTLELPISLRLEEGTGAFIAKTTVQNKIDIKTLLTNTVVQNSFKKFQSISAEVFLIKNFERIPIKPYENGVLVFSQLESYLVVHCYRSEGSNIEKCSLYFWQGSLSSIIDKGTSAFLAVEVGKEKNCDITQYRIVEGKGIKVLKFEPNDFFVIFKIKCFVLLNESSNLNPTQSTIIEIRKIPSSSIVKAVEVVPEYLTFSNYSSIIVSSEKYFSLWIGSSISQSEKDAIELIRMKLNFNDKREIQISENELLNGIKFEIRNITWTARLFLFTIATGVVTVSEVVDFSQDDLEMSLVGLLVYEKCIFVWIGDFANSHLVKFVLETLYEYFSSSEDSKFGCKVVYAYSETLDFVQFFHGWTKAKIPAEKGNLNRQCAEFMLVYEKLHQQHYTKSQLLSQSIPSHLDKTKLELYLSEKEFEETFLMSKKDYDALPLWKRENLRKKYGFY
ncbi:Coronin-2B [Boothiomyces sp. JEL0866]|nr:Coronin-2B [Boothiomyces sp. JEL0866]